MKRTPLFPHDFPESILEGSTRKPEASSRAMASTDTGWSVGIWMRLDSLIAASCQREASKGRWGEARRVTVLSSKNNDFNKPA